MKTKKILLVSLLVCRRAVGLLSSHLLELDPAVSHGQSLQDDLALARLVDSSLRARYHLQVRSQRSCRLQRLVGRVSHQLQATSRRFRLLPLLRLCRAHSHGRRHLRVHFDSCQEYQEKSHEC